MKRIELKESDSTFIYYTLRQYARTTENLDKEDRDEIMDLAIKFKNN